MADDAFDACVIGSGAGGGAAAWKLAKAGLRVLVLERGPHYAAKDFVHDELAVCRRDYFVPNPARDPHLVSRGGGALQRSAEGWISCCVGGGTVHMSGYFFRMHREDFRGWPISFDDLEPYYDEVEREIGVSGAGVPGEPRRRPHPLPPLLAHRAANLIEDACSKLGLRPFPIPRAIVSGDYRGRQACTYCGFCGSYGCEVGAKSSTLETFLAAAQRTGHLTLRAQCRATRIAATAGRRSVTAPVAPNLTAEGGTETVLLVEDEPQLRVMASRILRSNGYAVLEAPDGVQAILTAGAHDGRIDLLLFASGYSDTPIDLAAHGNRLLTKPFTPVMLLHRVRQALDG